MAIPYKLNNIAFYTRTNTRGGSYPLRCMFECIFNVALNVWAVGMIVGLISEMSLGGGGEM